MAELEQELEIARRPAVQEVATVVEETGLESALPTNDEGEYKGPLFPFLINLLNPEDLSFSFDIHHSIGERVYALGTVMSHVVYHWY